MEGDPSPHWANNNPPPPTSDLTWHWQLREHITWWSARAAFTFTRACWPYCLVVITGRPPPGCECPSYPRGLLISRTQDSCFTRQRSWFCLYWQVFYLHIILGVQDLLRVRLHAAGIHHTGHCNYLRHNCVYILPTECWGLQVVRTRFVFLVIFAWKLTYCQYDVDLCVCGSKVTWCADFGNVLTHWDLVCRQWTSFLSAASTAAYVYLYSFYYFFFKTK